MRGHFFKLVLMAALGTFLLLWNPSVSSQNIEVADSDFDQFSWWATGVELSFGASVDGYRMDDCGLSGPCRVVVHELPFPDPRFSSFARATSAHSFTGYSFDPLEAGPLRQVSTGYGVSELLGGGWLDFPTYGQSIVVQDERVFRSNDETSDTQVTDISWRRIGHFFLDEDEFWAVDGSCDQPDFSASGGAMQFGFALTGAKTSIDWPLAPYEPATIQVLVDDWFVNLEPGADPQDPLNNPPTAVTDTLVIDGYRGTGRIDATVNDLDTDGNGIVLKSISPAPYGLTRRVPASSMVEYRHLGGSTTDRFCYTIRDLAPLPKSSKGVVDVIVDCTCALSCMADVLPGPNKGVRPAGATKGDNLDLGLIYRVRDEMFAEGVAGRRFIDYYYSSTPELIRLLVLDEPALGAEAVNVAELWSSTFSDYLDGPGDALISQAQADALGAFIANLFSSASPGLQQLITDEMNALGDLQDYVGMTSRDALTKALVIDGIFRDGFEDLPVIK